MKFALYILLAIGALAAGCDQVEVSTSNQSGSKPPEDASSSMLGPPTGQQTLIQRIAGSREVSRFQGVRLVEVFLHEGATQHHTIVRELVSADGLGAYAIETVDVIEPPLSSAEGDLFNKLQSPRQGMNWRYRDFGIRNVDLFVQNYVATDTGAVGLVVAGRPVIELRVERIDQSGSIYTLLVDAPSGLVLKSREESNERMLLGEMCYETLEFAPDLAAVAWHQNTNNEQVLPTGRLIGQMGFEFRSPRTLPVGFQLLERSSVMHSQDGSPWIKATYTDGIENLFFLHGGPIAGGNGIKSGVPEIQADLVEVTLAAPWTIARGNLRSQRVIALGKVSEADILVLLRSAME